MQNYEEYWKLTLEYSDIHGERFRGTLKIIVDFIDENQKDGYFEYSEEKYKLLQEKVNEVFPKKDMGSVRKSINQFVKLGFINYKLESYHKDTRHFLEATTKRKRCALFSKILYTNSSFNRDVTIFSDKQEINFLIKTLENMGKLHKSEIMALMKLDISSFPDGCVNRQQLKVAKEHVTEIKFKDRKYNQVSYLWTILNKLEDLYIQDEYVCFKEDAEEIFGDYTDAERKRDPYMHRLYKIQLKIESEEKLNTVKCMVEKLEYPSLIASHIKPFRNSDDFEAYDSNNGLLLSRNIDSLFDLGYVTFNDNGNIILAQCLANELKKHLGNYSLDTQFINKERLSYLDYHRKEVFKREKN